MSQITAKVIEDSISSSAKRLVTMQLVYPRFIHAEAKTHRVLSISSEEAVLLTQDDGFMSDPNLSRNASSSRAIPVAKMLEQVRNNPAMPVHWGANQPGMQAYAECNELITVPGDLADAYGRFCGVHGFYEREKATREDWWKFLGWIAAAGAEAFSEAGYHKQIVNRRLEADQLIHVIVTASEWDNFFELRNHPAAQPEIRALAIAMQEAMEESKATTFYRASGDIQNSDNWHLPYVTVEERLKYPFNPTYLAKLSAARCARVSFLNHDGTTPVEEKDIALYDMLVGSRPLHASPVEHQAYPDDLEMSKHLWGNFKGWVQHRKLVENRILK